MMVIAMDRNKCFKDEGVKEVLGEGVEVEAYIGANRDNNMGKSKVNDGNDLVRRKLK